MKKLLQAGLCVMLSLGMVGCGSKADYNNSGDILRDMMKNESFKEYIKATKDFTAKDDPNGIMGEANQYIAKSSWEDSRIDTEKDNLFNAGSIEVFNNEADANMRVHAIETYNTMVNEAFTAEKYGDFASTMLVKNKAVHQKGNAIIVLNINYTDEHKDEYFKLFDETVKDFSYKQTKVPSKATIEKITKEKQEGYDKAMATAISIFEDGLNQTADEIDTELFDLETSLSETKINSLETDLKIYDSAFFSDRYSGWMAKIASLKTTIETNKQAEAEKKAAEEEKARIKASASLGQKNALTKAKSYLRYMSFSYQGLVDQLLFEGFTAEEAAYGVEYCDADWNAQASKKAKSYIDTMSFSRQGLLEQLLFEGFTQEQAEYGVSAIGY